MHLLNVHTYRLEYFLDPKRRPDYAILSHTWSDGEVSFQDLPTPAAETMAGYAKIKKCCEQGIQDGFEYVWIDTCCIDKTSSSELSEAINSMYQWYRSARVCYVFLPDVKSSIPGGPTTREQGFSESRWFTRGWTLQELLAPRSVVFFSHDWVEIGTKHTLQEEISKITGIPSEVLLFLQPLSEISIAQRMSWASTRQTTREEDEAYCLMGIFDVNMPTLYGEGQKAFVRLQYEIMKNSDDHSLFAWTNPTPRQQEPKSDDRDWMDPDDKTFLDNVDKDTLESGLLASSPKAFQYSQGVRRLKKPIGSKSPYSITNNGLHIRLPLAPVDSLGHGVIYLAILNCEDIHATGPMGVYLKQNQTGQCFRILPSIVRTSVTEALSEPVELYVKEIYSSTLGTSHLDHKYEINLAPNPSMTILDVYKSESSLWLLPTCTFKLNPPQFRPDIGIAAVRLGFGDNHAVQAVLILGLNNKKDLGFWRAIHPPPKPSAPQSLEDFCASNPQCMGQFNFDRITEQFPNGHIISAAIHSAPRNLGSLSENYRIVLTERASNSFLSPDHQHSQALSINPSPASPLPKLTLHLNYEMIPKIQQGEPLAECWSVLRRRSGSTILFWSPTPEVRTQVCNTLHQN